jgi:hypothetical protein
VDQAEFVCGKMNVTWPAYTDFADAMAKTYNQIMIASHGIIFQVAESPVKFAEECSALRRAGDRRAKRPCAKMLGVAQVPQVVGGEGFGRAHRRILIANNSHLH